LIHPTIKTARTVIEKEGLIAGPRLCPCFPIAAPPSVS
jgi:hypothetical protein